MKKLLLLVAAMLAFNSTFASSKDKDFFFINLRGTLNNKMIVNSSFDNPILQSSNKIFGEIGVGYKHLWNNGVGIKTSLDFGGLPSSYKYDFQNVSDKGTINNWYISLDAMFVKQFNITEKHAIGINLGLKEYWFIPTYDIYSIRDANESGDGFYAIVVFDDPKERFITSVTLAPEYIYTFDNGNYMSLGIELNYSPFKLYKENAEYQFEHNGKINDIGTMELGVNYIGISFEFGFN